jgi:coenzyme F420-reducing hydrogenase alpha subunit
MNGAVAESKPATIRVDTLARVEGEGSLVIKLRGPRVADVKLKIPEPPRLFEAFLRGRHFNEVPDITSRICGICPIAYQMSSIGAIEQALGVTVDPMVRLLRRLFYCGEWIESHALHVFCLHAPDFLGCQDVMELAGKNRPLVEEALRLKKIGNEIVRVIGGREIHPLSAAVGGFYRVPRQADLAPLVEDLRWALEASVRAAKLVSTFEFPDFDRDYEFVALRHPDEYAIIEGSLVSNGGLDIEARDYEDHFVEHQVKHSHALHSRRRARGAYLVGPLARFNLNFDVLPKLARETARECGIEPPCRNQFKSIIVRAVELIFACEEALRLIAAYEPPAAPWTAVEPRKSRGCGITEAPRGILYHRYEIDERGLIVSAKIVPPTAQNQKTIEDDLWELAPRLLDRPLPELTWRCEQAIRNYDPCISCATHFLKVRLEEC